MMRTLLYGIVMIALAACAKKEAYNAPTATAAAATSSTAEDTYVMTATIVSRDPVKNTLNLDNQEVPGKMMAMKMDYEVRDGKVAALPPDGTPVEVTMHDNNGAYSITGVKAKK